MALNVKDTEGEWNAIIELIEEEGDAVVGEVAMELPYARSQVHEAVRVEMKELDNILAAAEKLKEAYGDELEEQVEEMNKQLKNKKPRKLLLGYRRLLKKVDSEYLKYSKMVAKLEGEKVEKFNVKTGIFEDPVLEIALNGGMKLVQSIFEKIEGEELLGAKQRHLDIFNSV